jgi:SAM-dependent methyltransferase
MHEWFSSGVGRYVRDWEDPLFRALVADIFGFHAVQMGTPSIHALAESRMTHRWQTGLHPQEGNGTPPSASKNAVDIVSVVHDFHYLPFATHSVDLIILPHILELVESPHQVLREVNRVLIPEGKLIISGFNPGSLWGLRQLLGRMSGVPFLPEYARFIGLSRIKDWLSLLGLETNRGTLGCYLPPCRTGKWQKRFSFMEKAGARWWPCMGAVYVIQAIKQVTGLTLVGRTRYSRPKRAAFSPVSTTNRQWTGAGESTVLPDREKHATHSGGARYPNGETL